MHSGVLDSWIKHNLLDLSPRFSHSVDLERGQEMCILTSPQVTVLLHPG